MGKIVYGMISPHPPVLIPQVGGKRLKEAENTKKALELACKRLKASNPDTVIIITPHGDVSATTVHIYMSHVFEGDFSQFGAGKVRMTGKGDPELGIAINRQAQADSCFAAGIQESFLDHGVMVPWYYAQSAGLNRNILPVAVSLASPSEQFRFGQSIRKAVEASGKRAAVIASADMSHRLTQEAPAGYNPNGKVFDEKLVALIRANDVKGILSIDKKLADEAGQDALWSVSMLLGALDGSNCGCDMLSYEAPFGVGYMIAKYEVNR